MEQIQQPGIHGLYFTGSVIAHDVADSVYCAIDQPAMCTVTGLECFPCMNIVKRQYMVFCGAGAHCSQDRVGKKAGQHR
jgi:hypothetical protein